MDLVDEAVAYAAADFGEVNVAFVERVLREAGAKRIRRAVDLGTGPGDIALRVARARPDWHVAAVDASWAMLEIAARTGRQAGAAVRWIHADAKDLPLADRSVDLIFSNSLLHHLDEPGRLWSEVRRIAKSGCGIMLRDLWRPETPGGARRIVETHAGKESALLQEEFCRSLFAAYTLEEVREQLAQADLAHLEVAAVTDRHLDVWGSVR